MCSLSKICVTCQGLNDFHKGVCLQLDSYFTIFKLKTLSFKLSITSHSSMNLIYNSGTEVGVGMEGREKMEKKKRTFI